MLMVIFFLKGNYNKDTSASEKLKRIDYIGNTLLIASSIAVLYALSIGGAVAPWSSARVLTPLLVGFAGFVLFGWFETTRFAGEPVVPPHFFRSWTTSIIMIVTFLASMLLYWVLFFMPVYFQATLGSSPSLAGIQVLPSIVVTVPCSILAVLLMTRFGRYKVIHLSGFALMTLGLGLFSLLKKNSSTAEWVVFQIINSIGNGILMNSLLPACQATLPESDQAQTTAVWSSIRSFGSIWGVIIPAAIFNTFFDQHAAEITDASVRDQFLDGNAYSNANSEFLSSFAEQTRAQIVNVYEGALQQIWLVSLAFAGVCFLLVLVEREIVLRTELETEYGLAEKTATIVAEAPLDDAEAEKGAFRAQSARSESSEDKSSTK
jgi:hypothetical protein